MKYLNDKKARNDWRRIFWLKDNKINRIRIFSHNYEKSGPHVVRSVLVDRGRSLLGRTHRQSPSFDGQMSHENTIYEF